MSLAVYEVELIIGPALQVCWERKLIKHSVSTSGKK